MTAITRLILLTFLGLLVSPFSLHAQTGLTTETWNNLSARDSIIVLQKEGISNRVADATGTITDANLAGPTAAASGTRLRGTITPALTDNYTFWVSGADNVALWISTDASKFNKQLVCYSLMSTAAQDWDANATQKSLPIQLTGGQTYYLEAQVMDEDGGGHLSVAWRGQNGRYALDLNGSTATQSSTENGLEASIAIDGDNDGGSFSRTQSISNSWLQVDFGQDREINRVVLYHPSHKPKRLSNFRLSVLDANDVELAGQDFFTSSPNPESSVTWDLASPLPTARKIKIQLLGNNLDGNGVLAVAEVEAYGIGLVSGQVTHREVVPQSVLNTNTPDPADTNDNYLADAWETQKGLDVSPHPEALLEYGDPDKDGITNYQEQWFGSDPLSQDHLIDGLTQSIWMGNNHFPLSDFTADPLYYSLPNKVEHVPGVDDQNQLKYYGTRYRGFITAPVTGQYRFWVSGNGGGVELWLADGSIKEPGTSTALTNCFGKQMIATRRATTPANDFDFYPEQRSVAIDLVQGQEYYIEVLQNVRNVSDSHLQVAWEYPGQARQIIPASAYISHAPAIGDGDDDNLPDAWESANGLDPADNGYASLSNGEYGDPDTDGLNNLQEYQYGTNPNSSDSDGDGYSDAEEINYYGSDPLTSNNLAPVVVTTPPLDQYTSATGSWTLDANGDLIANERRGAITYSFNVAQPGVHEVEILGTALYYQNRVKTLHLTLALDGASTPFATGEVSSNWNGVGSMKAITPWLEAGTHTITIFHDNVDTRLRMKLVGVNIKLLGGADMDQNGVPDWVEDRAAGLNKLTQIASTSRTSPVSIEGITEQFGTVSLTRLPPGASQATEINATQSIDDRFYANVDLDESGSVALDASFMSGLVTESHNITWVATNLFDAFTGNTLHIRKGDSLRLDAWSGASADGQPFTVTLDGVLMQDSNQNTTHTSGVAFAYNFATAGSYTLVANHNGQSATVNLEVHSADFGPSHTVRVNFSRSWQPTQLRADSVVEFDHRIIISETTPDPLVDPRTFMVKADTPINRHVIARMPSGVDGAPSAILAQGTVHPFEFAMASATNDSEIVTRYADGTWLMSASIVAINLPDNAFVRIQTINQGTLFLNGTNQIELRAEDFDVNGIATVFYEWAGAGDPKLCHTASYFIEL